MRHVVDQGFTLLEVLLVIAIIGILAVVFIPAIFKSRAISYDTGARSCAKSLQTVQAISQVDNKTYMLLGSGTNQINRASDGVNSICKQSDLFFKDRSNPSLIYSSYAFDVWDRRGSRVITVMPSGVQDGQPNATPFSSDGLGGTNLP